ncbi:MAG: hypothetical protein JXM70_28680 [Pirellulales bacterium]|nr:hypothetical protein [Pirellulales bacterium]
MNTGKIVKQIKREAKSHPAKAFVLAVLAVVAVCYWTTLAWSWGDGGKNKSAKIPKRCNAASVVKVINKYDPKTILATELAKINATNKTEDRPQHGWKQIVEWIENDPRTLTVKQMPGRPDAFEMAEEPKVEEQVKKKEEPKPKIETVFIEPEITPQQLEMTLSSTLVGPSGGVALIDGKAYKINQTVTSEKDKHKTAFKLTEVHPKYVTLTHKNKKYKLLLPEKELPGNIQIKIRK